MSCSVGYIRGLDPMLLWCRLAAVALIPPLAWERPYAVGVPPPQKKEKLLSNDDSKEGIEEKRGQGPRNCLKVLASPCS